MSVDDLQTLNILLVMDRRRQDMICALIESTSLRFEAYCYDPAEDDVPAMDPAEAIDLCLLSYVSERDMAIDLLHREYDNIPIILLFDGTDSEAEHVCATIDVDDVLAKEGLNAQLLVRTIRHVVERRRNMAALARCQHERDMERHSLDLLQGMMDYNPLLNIVKDREDRIVFVNTTVATLFDMTTDEVIGMKFHELFSLKEEQSRQADIEVLSTSRSISQIEHCTINGTERDLLITRFPITSSDGDVLMGINATVDSTSDSNETLSKLEKAYARQRDLIANVSHDFRTPLTIIRAGVERLQELRGDDPSIEKSILRIANGAERLEQLVQDLLLLTRLANELSDGDRKRTRFDGLVADAISKLSKASREKKIDWHLELQEVVLYCDVESIRRAVHSLLDNAVKFSPTEGMVTVTTRLEDGKAVLTVADNGPGIPPEEIPKVFDHFHRADQARTTSGAGLGLAIVKATVMAHSGHVLLHTTPQGISMTVTLPIGAP